MAHIERSQPQQLNLPLLEDLPPAPAKNGSNFSDPNFAGNKGLPIHRWVPWIAGFSSEFVKDALQRYLKKEGVVLDPFAGVGTTLVEAILGGHNAVGFEINPYAAMACRVKTGARKINIKNLYSKIEKFQEFYRDKVSSNYRPVSEPPEGFRTRSPFYSPKVLRKVLILQDFISEIEIPIVKDLFQLAFAATMVSYSNYSYEPSLGRRVSAGKAEIEDFSVDKAVRDKLMEMADDIRFLQSNGARRNPDVRIINDSFLNCREWIESESVDLIITSPPYLNNYHYIRNTRPHLYWLGYAEKPKDLKPLEELNFGKYWQTVRDLESVDLEFALPDGALADQLKQLGKLNKKRGPYGGQGWANYAASYFNDCHRFAQGIHFALKPGGVALVVIGNSILQGVMIPTDQYLGQIAESTGLELVDIDIPRATRVGNSIIKSDVRVKKAKDSHQLYEAIVELRRP